MPEINFQIEWSDGSQQICYSPSLVIQKYFTPGEEYELQDFLTRARTALHTASDRVKAVYGYPCSLALGQLQQIEAKAKEYEQITPSKVRFIQFLEKK